MAYRVIVSEPARPDWDDIVKYVSADNQEAAKRFGRLLLSKTKPLADFPEMGRTVPEYGDPAVREIMFAPIASFTDSITQKSEWKLFASGMQLAAHQSFS